MSNPIVQVVKRVHEYEAVQCSLTNTDVPVKQLKLGANGRDSVVFLKSGRFAEIIDKTGDHVVCNVYKKSCMQPLFLEPCSSHLLDIVYIKYRAGILSTAAVADLGGGGACPPCPPSKILLAVWSRYKSSICRIYLFQS